MAMRPTTGDSSKAVAAHATSFTNLAIVTQAQLANAADPHNINVYSQKQPGSCFGVKMTTGGAICIAVSQGFAPTDKWTILGDTAATPVTSITPA